MKNLYLKNTLIAAVSMACLSSYAATNQDRHLLVTPLKSLGLETANVAVSLSGASPLEANIGEQIRLDLRALLNVTDDSGFNLDGVSWSAGAMPAGLNLRNGVIQGVVEQAGVQQLQVAASYKLKKSSQAYAVHGYKTVVLDDTGAYRWSDNSLASSCLEYLNPGPELFARPAPAVDGIYKVSTPSGPVEVLCDMTRDGGGWTMITKQAQGDGVTLQGDTAYWTQGVVLNDNRASLNKNSGNYMSALYSSLPVTEFRLEASNESTRKFETKTASVLPIQAFSDAAATRYSDDVGTTGTLTRPNWALYITQYQNGQALTSVRFAFNHVQISTAAGNLSCAARWGWTLNQDAKGFSLGTHDACAGLGAYGIAYGSASNPNKNTFQTATFYLWVR